MAECVAKTLLKQLPGAEKNKAEIHICSRGTVCENGGKPHGTALQAPTIPFRLFQTPPRLGGAVASLGAHTDEFTGND